MVLQSFIAKRRPGVAAVIRDLAAARAYSMSLARKLNIIFGSMSRKNFNPAKKLSWASMKVVFYIQLFWFT
jgi:hypothetical protein